MLCLELLVIQSMKEYTSPKCRMTICGSNGGLFCQLAYDRMKEDMVVCAASAYKLPNMCGLVSKPR